MTAAAENLMERKRFEETLRLIVEGTASGTGEEFFRALVKELSAALHVPAAFVTRCVDFPPTHVVPLAFWMGNDFVNVGELPLQGYPCQQVIEGNLTFCECNLKEKFPEAIKMHKVGIDSFLGIPLSDSKGAIIGHLAVMDREPMSGADFKMAILRIFASRGAAELERLNAESKIREQEAIFRSIVEGTSAVTGGDFFRSLVRHLSKALDAKYAFIARKLDSPDPRARTLAFWNGNGFGDDFEIALPGTPCEEVMSGKLKLYPAGVNALFPASADLANWGAESFLGVPLLDSAEDITGYIAVVDVKPMEREEEKIALIRIFAARAAAELERLRVEEAMGELNIKLSRSNLELKEINEELKNLTYIVSHDLRAPLVSIKGFSAELQGAIEEIVSVISSSSLPEQELQRLQQLIQEEVQEAVGFIGSSVTRMDRLISSILNLSRAGRREFKPEPVDINTLLKGVLDSLAHQIERQGVRVNTVSLPPLMVDRAAMEQIIGNLVDNALKYLQQGRKGELSLSAAVEEDQVIFQIKDNGRGIRKEDQERIFELFQRAGKDDVPGEGMGLTYVKTLVRRHGGRIWCESELGMGTTFFVSLPATCIVNKQGDSIAGGADK